MRRREVLGGLAGAGAAGLSGCLGLFETESARQAPPLVEDRPDAVYYPTHVEGMEMAGMKRQDGYACALTYTYPHRFWLMTGTRSERVDIADGDSVHLMPVVWETETGIVPPDVNPQVAIERDGGEVAQFAPWPMLSQPMGFHFGDNVGLPGNDVYDVTVSIGSPSTRRTGAAADATGNVEFEFEFDYREGNVGAISYRDIPSDTEGTPGAVEPMDMEMMPSTRAPARESMPGTVRGSATSGDAAFVVTTLEDATPFGGGEEETYLAVSPRTPYNRYVLPMMSLSATLERGDETVYDDVLRATIDPDLRYHYGAVVSGVESGDALTVTVDAPPQTARHEGYETAFVDMPAMDLTL
jgi:hypothetical protein